MLSRFNSCEGVDLVPHSPNVVSSSVDLLLYDLCVSQSQLFTSLKCFPNLLGSPLAHTFTKLGQILDLFHFLPFLLEPLVEKTRVIFLVNTHRQVSGILAFDSSGFLTCVVFDRGFNLDEFLVKRVLENLLR
jgi:hypothetical protein